MIDTDEKLAGFLAELRQAKWIALDTEADSLHAYPEKLCLMQVGIDGHHELVDPLTPMDLSPLWEVFRKHELILHGADYDLRLLRKSGGFIPTAIFDTMLASRLLGFREFGLNSLVSRFLGVQLEKGPQKANWARRPLTPRMEEYALNDIRYLRPLADLLRNQLVEKKRLSWHQEYCERLIADSLIVRPPDPDQVWRVKGSHELAPTGLAVLREVWLWREQEAIAANRPPYFILNPQTMVALAKAGADGNPLEAHLPRRFSPRRKDQLLKVIRRGLEEKNPPGFLRRRGHRPTEAEKKRAQELERRRDAQASKLDIDPTLIASRATLMNLARDWDHYKNELMSWQRHLFR